MTIERLEDVYKRQGGSVAAHPDGVVGQHEHAADFHQGRHADGAAAVVGEHQKGATERHVAAVQRQTVHDRVHREFARAVKDQIAVRVLEIDRPRACLLYTSRCV